VDSRRLLLGDWTPVVRDGIDVLRLVLVGGAVGWAVAGDAAAAVYLAGFALLALLARLVQLPRVYDLAFTAAMAFQAYAEVTGVYDAVGWFDRLVHVTLPLLTAPVVYIGLARLEVVPDPRDETHLPHYVGVGVVTAALAQSSGGDTTELKELARLFHRLAGSGGSYGIDAVTTAARAGEHLADALAPAGKPLSPEDAAALQSHIAGVAAAFEAARDGSLPEHF